MPSTIFPLQNKIIISVQAEPLETEALFLEQKAVFFCMPTIEIRKIEINDTLISVLKSIQIFDYLIFTSKNGVENFFSIISELKISIPPKMKFAVIGKKTEKALSNYNFKADIKNSGNTSDELIEQLKNEKDIKNKKLLYITGNLAKNSIKENLQGIAEIERIDVYSTQIPEKFDAEILNRIRTKNYDWLIFTSPSTFENLLKITKFDNKNQFNKIAVIGQTTEKAIQKNGFSVDAVAEEASGDGILNKIKNYELRIKNYDNNYPLNINN
jgi:uroporphyrinogen-III synthase